MNGKKAPTLDLRCGTSAGYQAHRKRMENACESCRKANNEYTASKRDPGQSAAYDAARKKAWAALAQRHPEEYRELFEAEYPRALAKVREREGKADAQA